MADNTSPKVSVLGSPTSGLIVSGTSYPDLTGLTPGHSYTWYIGSDSTNGLAAIGWSGPQTFTLAPLTQPTLLGPSGTTTSSGSTTFSWSPVAGAKAYYVYVLDNTTNQSLSNPADTLTTFASAIPHDNYTWYVAAVSTNSTTSVFSESTFSLVPATLGEPKQIGPSGTIAASAGYDMPTFSWGAAVGATSYYLYVLDNTTNKPAAFNSSTMALAGTLFTPSAAQALNPGDNYTWYIGAESSGPNGPIAWSTQTFALAAMPAPTQIFPLAGAFDRVPHVFLVRGCRGQKLLHLPDRCIGEQHGAHQRLQHPQ